MKKILAILCAAMLLVACCIPVLAAGSGSITINNTVATQEYAIYKLLDLSYSGSAYTYTVNSAWDDFFDTAKALEYVTIDASGAVTWKAADDDATVAAFAELALSYAKEEGIAATETQTASSATVVFTGLEYGYYLIDSSVGTLCILDTTDPDFEKDEKNKLPEITKTVGGDDTTAAEVGDELEFTITITKEAGAFNYVLHDTMTEGLDFSGTVTITTTIGGVTTPFSGYDLITDPIDSCTFEVKFHNDALAAMKDGTVITITYTATLNKKAIDHDEETNEAVLKYGEDNDLTTTKPVVSVTTYKAEIVKTTDKVGATYPVLDGAKFTLYDVATDGTAIKVVEIADGQYRIAMEGEAGAVEEMTTKGGKLSIDGLDDKSYYLEETVAPAGYNKLTARQEIPVTDKDLTLQGEIKNEGGVDVYDDTNDTANVDIHIINKTGAVLPETGGFGTTMFILIGGGLMLCTGILLVAKKRMEKIAD